MTYEAWRISYQSSEQAARAAYVECGQLQAKITEMEKQGPVGTAHAMPGTEAFTMACFHVQDIPVGTKLYALPCAEPVVTPKMEQAFYEKVEVTSIGSIRGLADGIKAAMLAAAKEAKP